MTTGNQYNDKFKSHLGEGGTKAHKYCHMSGGPWCCAEVSLVYGETNKSLFYGGKYCTYCPNAIKWCRAYLAELPMYLSMGGDIIFFDWNNNGVPDHIGEVDYRIDTDKIATVEGNTGSPARVRKKVRPRKYVLGVFRPLYAPATTPTKEPLKIDGAFEYKSVYMLQVALGLTPTGIFDKTTLKKWQAKVGTTPDGSWQKKTTLAAQGFLGVKKDGAWGAESTKAWQRWINNVCFPSSKPLTKPVEPQPYAGEYPDLVTHSGQIIAQKAKELAWAKGTKKAKYKYPDGSATKAFNVAINKVYPKRSSWSKQCAAGASCDVGAGTIIRASGYDTAVPRGLEEQLTHFRDSSRWEKTGQKKCTKPGDVGMHPSPSAHIWIHIWDGLLAEANHTWKYFEHLVKDNRKINNKAKAGVYRPCKPTAIKRGHIGSEVKKWQSFLHWFGYDIGVDSDFGPKTDEATKDFQKNHGLESDGIVGSMTIAKAKEVRK